MLNQAKYKKSTFGESYYKLDITKGEFEALKSKI